MRRTILASLALHSILFGILFWNQIPIKSKLPLPEKVEFEFQESLSPTVTAPFPKSGLKIRNPKPQISLEKLLPNSKPLLIQKSAPTETELPKISDAEWFAQHPREDQLSSSWGEGSETLGRLQDQNLFAHLYEKIDGHLFYPGILARKMIDGTVNARLILDDQGACDFHNTQIFGHDKHLKFYVLHVLKSACKQNFGRYLGGRKKTLADLSFRFEITEHNDPVLKAREKFTAGNVLLFYRNAHQSVAEWNLGPFRGMFPIPVINLDFQRIQEEWDKYFHGIDPMDEYNLNKGTHS